MKKVYYAAIFVCFALFSNTLPCEALQLHQAKIPEIETLSSVLEWRYKVINGKLYKRLYNLSIHEWIGDWILV